MKVRPSLIESSAIVGFFVLGVTLRVWHLDLEAVEHFDEGIYASVLWHDGTFNAPYPAREFYAPPMLSTLIEVGSLIPGIGPYAPFFPAAMMGSLSILALWWLARCWFGKAAGIFIAAVVALSDFHIIYSRMALTDVPCLFWIVGSVYFGTLALQTNSVRNAVIAGFVCGLAWWTKYTGWLPLAIIFSGGILWWIWVGRKSIGVMRVGVLFAAMLAAATLTFAPWWWHLQSVGGYSAVAANHASYMPGISAWTDHLSQQLTFQFWQDGTFGGISLGLGMVASGLFRWFSAARSTWNVNASNTLQSNLREDAGDTKTFFPPINVLLRFLVAGVAILILALRIWTPLMLVCLALGGFGGMYLWPVLRRSWDRAVVKDLSPTSADALPLAQGDLDSAATIDPALGLCTTLTWFVGMLVATPFYHPYGRLFFPLLASVWLAAAGGVSWWMESNLSVARRMIGTGEVPVRRPWTQSIVQGMLVAAVVTSFLRFDDEDQLDLVDAQEVFHSQLFQDRTSIVAAANEIADLCVLSARSEVVSVRSSVVPDGQTIFPESVLGTIESIQPPTQFLPDDRRRERLVVYAFGEPALLMHLANAGLTVSPVGHLNLQDPGGVTPAVPTFIVIGPNAKRTPGFWEMWLERTTQFESVGDVAYLPSEVTLLDLFKPKWLTLHPEARSQMLEVHRVR